MRYTREAGYNGKGAKGRGRDGERFWVSDPFSFDIQWITSAIKARNVAYSSGVNYTEPRNSL